MKKKLTLLIALSIAIIVTATSIFVSASKSETTNQSIIEETTSAEDVESNPPSAVIEIVVEEEKPTLLSIEEIAKEVIKGKWGSGEERKTALIEAGYDYDAIQTKVDELMPKSQTTEPVVTPNTKLPTGEYPEAQLIWNTMISWGWTPETCAGIIGNMMAEIGGGTLDLSDWNSNGGCGYGLIQWTGTRRSTIKNRYGAYPTIAQQLVYMKDELFGTNDTCQQISANILSVIMNENGKQSPETIAFSFASNYERCARQYRERRKAYARIAYDYFMNK